jgi:thiamine-phosphate pyrophosphorylase
MADNLAASLRLLLVTDDRLVTTATVVERCRQAVASGVTAVQVRFKLLGDNELYLVARQLVASLPVPVYLNDRVDIALAVGAAGVHLGADDLLAPAAARRLAPPGFVIGASVGSAEEVERGKSADYWGIGPLHGSTTKGDAGAALGWDGAAALQGEAGHRPTVLIGGVTPADVAEAARRGFAGVAVASGILGADDVAAAAARFVAAGAR